MHESQIEALHVLRDHVSMLEVYLTAHRENKETKSGRKYCNLDSLAEEENDDGNRNAEQVRIGRSVAVILRVALLRGNTT